MFVLLMHICVHTDAGDEEPDLGDAAVVEDDDNDSVEYMLRKKIVQLMDEVKCERKRRVVAENAAAKAIEAAATAVRHAPSPLMKQHGYEWTVRHLPCLLTAVGLLHV